MRGCRNWTIAKVATVISLLLSFSSSADNSLVPRQIFEPDHYLSYDVKAGPHTVETVTLKDQFIGPVDFIVEKPIKLLNPTLKRHNNVVVDIKYPRLHYTSYQISPIQDLQVNATVLVYNQFGQFVFDQFRPSRLLAPTRKVITPTFTNPTDKPGADAALQADHYLCYDIPRQTVATSFGYLKDQFRSRGFENLIATRLCNPVTKVHGEKVFQIVHQNEMNHLLCFELSKKTIFKMAALVDQFGTKGAVAFNDDELCVPSIKIKLSSDQCEGSLPDFEGQCNGSCPDPTNVCLPDPASQVCRCRDGIPTQCVDNVPNPDGQCNGECPDNQVCIADLVNDTCQCREITNGCTLSADGQCGGACPAGEICIAVPGANECDCIPAY
jgi:hypothetical protein